jgi:hypothetical protein
VGRDGGIGSASRVIGRGAMEAAERVAMIVRHAHTAGITGCDAFAANHERDVDPLAGHAVQARFEGGALG